MNEKAWLIGSLIALLALGAGLVCGDKIGYQRGKLAGAAALLAQHYDGINTPGVYHMMPSEGVPQ